MKLTINPTEVVKRIKIAEKVIHGKSIFPILDDFLISVKNNSCVITASDGDVQLSLIVNILSSDGEFDFCADAKKFSSIIGAIKSDEATIQVDNGELSFKHRKGKLTIPCIDAKDFPLISIGDEKKSTVVNAGEIYNSVCGATYACSTDELRPQLNGVFFDFVDDGYNTVSTDTHKLVKIKNEHGDIEKIASFIMPSKVAGIVCSLVESSNSDVQIANDGNMGEIVSSGNFRLTFKQVNGKYPNYNAVFPKELNNMATINKNELMESLRRVLLAAPQQVSCVLFKFAQNELHVSAQDLDYNTSADEIIECNYDGEPIDIAFNGNDFLSVLINTPSSDGLLKIFLADSSRAIVVKPNSEDDIKVDVLLMPMYVGQ